jgi:hypothetical protein
MIHLNVYRSFNCRGLHRPTEAESELYSSRKFATLEFLTYIGNLNAKVDKHNAHLKHMAKQITGNDLRIHRRRCFLSQKELGRAIGYKDAVQVGRHEQSQTVPPFLIACAYEAVF